MSDYGPCEVCGAVSESFFIPVWENPQDHPDSDPDYVGCTECGTMVEYNE